MKETPAERPIPFFTTTPSPCPYIPGRVERKLVTELDGGQAEALHDALSQAGFRRSHRIIYVPACPDCSACVPVRVPVERFRAGRNLRRVWNRNSDLTLVDRPAEAREDHFHLFREYELARHGEGDMACMDFRDYQAMVEETPVQTWLMEAHHPEAGLVGVCLADELGDGLSAVYSFFAPGMERRSLGSFLILCLIERARALGLPHVYLGFWIAESRKMAYKARFRPLEGFGPDGWHDLASDAPDG